MTNRILNHAMTVKNNEWCTRYEDIEAELCHYKDELKGKVIYCNCDDPNNSAFVKFFLDHFEEYGLKRLIATSLYEGIHEDFLTNLLSAANECGYVLDTDIDTHVRRLSGNGDFRSKGCLDYLKQCDVVITNPPFSLFKEFLPLVVNAYHKDCLLIGLLLQIHYTHIFPLFKSGLLHLGLNQRFTFITSKGLKQIGSSVWITTLKGDYKQRDLELTKLYDPDLYPEYDDYNAINCDRCSDIPKDYYGNIGVPVSILKLSYEKEFNLVDSIKPYVGGKSKFQRLIIKRNDKETANT